MKNAILQVADTGPLESLVVMLRSAGYHCHLPDRHLRDRLRNRGCDTVLDIQNLILGMGYEAPFNVPETGIPSMKHADLYVDVKAQRNYEHVVKEWPSLEGKVLWYRINGGKPEHVVNARGDMGDEVDPPCPVLTPNQWYSKRCTCGADRTGPSAEAHADDCAAGLGWTEYGKDRGRAYAFWPPFVGVERYQGHRGKHSPWEPPMCLIHNLEGWGYGALVEAFRDRFGLRCYGRGSPDGLVNHRVVPVRLANTLAYLHLKSSDAPGYALYEALATGTPVVCTRRLIWRCKMQDLLIPGKTCLVFDRETHDPLTSLDIAQCLVEVGDHLKALQDLDYNREIGTAGQRRLEEVMWSPSKAEDVDSLKKFMERNFK